jgi:carbamoyl-phosphate synthase large subunit
MAIAETFGEAISKAFFGAGDKLPTAGGVFISVNNNDKNYKTVEVAKGFRRLGFRVFATSGTAAFLSKHGVENAAVMKMNEGRPNVVDFVKNGDIHIVVNTPLGETSRFDELAIGSAALEAKLPIITTISAAAAVVKGIEWLLTRQSGVRSLQEYHSEERPAA